MRIRYLRLAEAEYDEAVAWYRQRSLAAARHFREEVVVAERLLAEQPRIGKPVESEVRSLCVNDFPYMLIYGIRDSGLVVLAVAHHSRRPGYWHDRLKTLGK